MIQYAGTASAGGGGGVATTYPVEMTWQSGGTLDADNLVATTWAEVETLAAGLDGNLIQINLDATYSSTFTLTTPTVSLSRFSLYGWATTSPTFTITLSIGDGVTGSDWFAEMKGSISVVRTGTGTTDFISITGSGKPVVVYGTGEITIDNQNVNSALFKIGGNRMFIARLIGAESKFGDSHAPIVEVASNSAQVQAQIIGRGSYMPSNAIDRAGFSGANISVKIGADASRIDTPAYSPDEFLITGKLRPSHQVALYTASGILGLTDTVVEVGSTAPQTLTLLDLGLCEEREFLVSCIEQSSAYWSFACVGVDTFSGGATTIELNPGDSMRLIGNPSYWYPVITRKPMALSTGAAKTSNYQLKVNEIACYDASGGTLQLTLPNPANFRDGSRTGIKNVSSSATGITVSAGADTVELIGARGTTGASDTVGVAGECVIYELKGTTWHIVGGE